MVHFEVIKKEKNKVMYRYFPESKSMDYGIIVLDLLSGNVFVLECASSDVLRRVSVKELNSLRDSVNQMRRAEGIPLLTEEEWPLAKEPVVYYVYGDHAVKRIREEYEEGKILEKGSVAWY